MTRADRAQRVLDSLGTVVKRPSPPAQGVSEKLCRYGCGTQLLIAHLATGQWCALERHHSGDITLERGTAVSLGPQHAPDASKFVFHRCGAR